MYDVIIIGAGPAGISAAIYAKRAGANVLVLYHGQSNIEKTEKIDNYYGFIDGIDGKKLYSNGIAQARNLEIEVKEEQVLDIEKIEEQYKVKTEKEEYNSKTVIISTGNKKLKPNIKGINQFEGRGISYCAICDGFFYRNKKVAVIGSGKYAISEAEELKQIASNVIILTNGESIEGSSNFELITQKIKEIRGKEKLESVEFEDGTELNVDGIFIAYGQAGGVDFAKKLGIIVNNDRIVVDENMQTNIKGLYACGDVTGGMQQICKSIYEGAIAGQAASKFGRSNPEPLTNSVNQTRNR